MIIEGLLSVFITVLTPLISALPTISFDVPSGLINWIKNILTMSSMFLPIPTLLKLFALDILITNFNIVWKLIMKAWNALPFT